MATMYVTWHKYTSRVVGATTMQVEGPMIASAPPVDISAGGATANAPQGAEYAEVWADAPFYYRAGPTAAKDSTCKPFPANTPIQIDAVGLSTQIAGIAI